MNHRIRELAEQAGADFIDASKDYFGDYHPAGVSTDRIDLQKFAELLIRECSYRCYLIGESDMAYELSNLYGFKFDFRKMMEEDDE
jgi:hypothetical protein